MSYNGSGTFNINTAGQPVVDGTVISSSVFNALTADLGTGLTTAITKDGQTTPTANIPLGTFKITGLGAGTAATDAVRMSQLQAGGTTFLTAAGTDTITATASPALTAYATGNLFTFVVAVTNTGAVTLNIDGLGAKAVTRDGTTALAANDLVATEVVIVVYDGTRFQVLNPNAATNYRVSGTLGVTGVATMTAAPVFSSATASLPMFTDGSKALVSNAMTGTGSVVMSASPTLTGTIAGASQTLSGTLGVTGVSTFAAGSAAAPSLTTTGDTNTGIFFPAADTIGFSEGGAEAMRIDSSGNVGIGATNPTYKLQIQSGASTILAGADSAATTLTDATQKVMRFGVPHYTNAEEPVGALFVSNESSSNTVLIGGGTAQFNAATVLRFYTAANNTTVTGTARMSIDSSGNVGIGTSSPSSKLTVGGNPPTAGAIAGVAASGGISLALSDNVNNSLYVKHVAGAATFGTDSGGSIAFGTNGFTEAMRIDSSGNVGIGTSSPVDKLDVRSGAIRLEDDYVLAWGASGYANYISGNLTSNFVKIITNGTEAMRIDSSGNLLVGTTANAITAYTASKSLVQSADYSGAVAQLINSTSTTGTQYFLAFGRGASVCGQITSGSTNSTSFTTSSDYRLKKDVQPITGALAKVQTLKPCTYKWVEDNTISEGFIAHELAEIFPQAVVGEKDAVNAKGNPVYQGVDTSFLVATLTAAIQEQQALITTLTAAIQELKAEFDAYKAAHP